MEESSRSVAQEHEEVRIHIRVTLYRSLDVLAEANDEVTADSRKGEPLETGALASWSREQRHWSRL
ncbi:MAG: hypothetical protein F4Y47_11165 [Acidobacteriia bacterium]|nr:hypothetical protein [Terriglobia bacterium]MYG03103.1 hypothetical protein [Terriglobia bacterium]MYK12325.1 hypothetical protein [Terriglobia bacterium]